MIFEFLNLLGNRKPINVVPKKAITDEEFIKKEIDRFVISKRYKSMIDGERYYSGHHDILKSKRTALGSDGNPKEITNLPNNRVVDNKYRSMVDQKVNYLVGKPFTLKSENDSYLKILNKKFNKKFFRTFRNIAEDSLNCGLGWLFINYDDNGELEFKRMKPYEIIAGWKDEEHTILDYAIRIYKVIEYQSATKEVEITKVEVYDDTGISFFEIYKNDFYATEPFHKNYFYIEDEGIESGFNWDKIPLIPFKYNNKEIPLINMVKSLQDGINRIQSNFQNQMEEDPRNSILILVNYDGQNLGEFRENLATYGAVKVRNIDGVGGDVRSLTVEVNAENYKSILEIFKKAIIENAKGYDAKDERMGGNPNQMNIQSMYSDIDLDANGIEAEYQASLEEMLFFINAHLYNSGDGDFYDETVEFVFNRDIMMNEGELIDNIIKSESILSKETIVAKHPWVEDVLLEMKKKDLELEAELNIYGEQFTKKVNDGEE